MTFGREVSGLHKVEAGIFQDIREVLQIQTLGKPGEVGRWVGLQKPHDLTKNEPKVGAKEEQTSSLSRALDT